MPQLYSNYLSTLLCPLQHTTFDTEPSYSYDEEPSGYSPQRGESEQPAFEFMERESDWEVPQHGRTSSAGAL